MPEQFRTRDCVVLVKGDAYPVTVSAQAAASGWRGGQGVRWVPATKDDFAVGLSDGEFGGFMLWGSDESSDQYTAMTRNQPSYLFSVMGVGSWVIMTSTYERYTYASRQAGPLVPLTYTTQDKLLFSLRGYFTNEDEWSLAGDARAPNENYVGFIMQTPSTNAEGYITIQTTL